MDAVSLLSQRVHKIGSMNTLPSHTETDTDFLYLYLYRYLRLLSVLTFFLSVMPIYRAAHAALTRFPTNPPLNFWFSPFSYSSSPHNTTSTRDQEQHSISTPIVASGTTSSALLLLSRTFSLSFIASAEGRVCRGRSLQGFVAIHPSSVHPKVVFACCSLLPFTTGLSLPSTTRLFAVAIGLS